MISFELSAAVVARDGPVPAALSMVRALARSVLVGLLALAAMLAGPTHLPAIADTAVDVDMELVLAVDISMSMDPDEQRLQRDGYVAALRDPTIIKAIKSGPYGRIAVTYFEWAGPELQIQLMPWRLIDGAATAEAFAAELAEKPYSRYRRTSISSALDYAFRQFGSDRYRGVRRVIDVSGDGANNSGPSLQPIKTQIVESGVVINGLPILLRPTLSYSSWDIPDLDVYYSNCVIGGPGSFMVPITRNEEFLSATRQKLLLEISGLMDRPRIMPAQLAQSPGRDVYDCTLIERGRRW